MTFPASHRLISNDEAQTEAFGAALGRSLLGGEVVALRGDLGAGKTRFVRGLAEGLGVDPDAIASPTYVVSMEHRGRRLDLAHLDAYRLAGAEELETIGWQELRQRSDLVIAVEWAERIEAALPPETLPERIDVTIAHVDEARREILLHASAEVVSAWRRVLAGEPCRRCGAMVPVASPTAPFCSDRCRLIDLGAWL